MQLSLDLVARKLPIVLPSSLLAWLQEKEIFPGPEQEALHEFWQNARNHYQPWAKGVDPRTHPLYMWGDDAQYDERGSKLVVVVLGHCLDEQTNSLRSCYPLFCIRDES